MKTPLDQARDYVISAIEQLASLENTGLHGVCQARELTRQFSHGVTMITGHLRTALERCARELFDRCGCPKTVKKGNSKAGKKPMIYFPIVAPSLALDSAKFAVVVETNIPGLPGNRPDLVTLLASFQAKWLADFATVCNMNKHTRNDPSVAVTFTHIAIGGGAIRLLGRGKGEMRGIVCNDCVFDLALDERGDVAKFDAVPGVDLEKSVVVDSIRFDAVNEEVIPFLHRAVAGVEQIVEKIAKRI
jgi:hypothetical protein